MLRDIERPAKRPRPDLETSSNTDGSGSLDGLTRDKDFWLVDGTIVLIARKVAFKVYMGLLAEQSLVFSDVFSSASPTSSELLDRVPVVHLSDSPEDLRHLLRVLLPNKQRWSVCFCLSLNAIPYVANDCRILVYSPRARPQP